MRNHCVKFSRLHTLIDRPFRVREWKNARMDSKLPWPCNRLISVHHYYWLVSYCLSMMAYVIRWYQFLR